MYRNLFMDTELSYCLEICPTFSMLPEEDIKNLTRKVSIKHIKKGEHVWKIGENSDYVFILVSGFIQLYTSDTKGTINTLAILIPPHLIGYIEAIADEKRCYNIMALHDSTILTIKTTDFNELLDRNPKMMRNCLETVCNASYMEMRFRSQYKTESPELKVVYCLVLICKHMIKFHHSSGDKPLDIYINQEILASFSNVSRPVANKVLKKYSSKGHITASYRSITILNPNQFIEDSINKVG